MTLHLRPLRLEDESAFLAAHDAMEAEHFMFGLGYERGMPWSKYVDRMADVDGEIVGRSSIRHELNEFLAHEGGHIGYGVVAEHRRRGYATEILHQSLVIVRSVGAARVLVTCDDDNVGSATVIEQCGGVFDSVVESGEGGKLVRRYWID